MRGRRNSCVQGASRVRVAQATTESYVEATAEARATAAVMAKVAAVVLPEVEPSVSWEDEVAKGEAGEDSNKRVHMA